MKKLVNHLKIPSEISHADISQLTLTQHKCFLHILRKCAQLDKNCITMKLTEFLSSLEIPANNQNKYIDEIQKLHKKGIALNIIGKNKTTSEYRFALLSRTIINRQENTFSFAIDEELLNLLKQGKYFAYLEMHLANTLNSKHALGLYLICNDYKNIGRTGGIRVNDLKKMMGVTEDSYSVTRKFSEKVKKTCKYLSKHSDIIIEPKVILDRKKIEGFYFEIRENPKPILSKTRKFKKEENKQIIKKIEYTSPEDYQKNYFKKLKELNSKD